MRRFQITSDKFTGTAELLYNDGGVLCRIDCTHTDMNADTIQAFKRATPALLESLVKGEGFAAGTTVVEADMEVTFDMFWKKYDKKINRKRSEQLWTKMTKTDQVQAYYGMDAYFKYLKQESWRTKLDPENYLRNKTWENEYK